MTSEKRIPAPYTGRHTEERPDIAELLGPTVARAMTASFNRGTKIGLAISFRKSGYRYAVCGATLDEAIDVVREHVAEYPHGRNRHGRAWEVRP